MGYTLSFDASCKVTMPSLGGYLNHVARDVDQKNDIEVRHSNKQIDRSRTKDNVTAVYGTDGSQAAYESTYEIWDALQDRLVPVKKPLRKDAVVLRPLLLQLDPDWYKEHTSEADRDKAAQDMIDWAMERFGPLNVIFASRHRDETNEHLHIGFCPVTDDGRLSQKDWFKSPAALREMHQDFRQHMAERGYDIEMTNKKPGKHAKRLTETEYKNMAELKKNAAEVAKREQAVAKREAEQNARENLLDARESHLEAREEQVARREVYVDIRAEAALNGLKTASKAIEASKGWQEQEAYRAAVARRQAEIADCGRYLDENKQTSSMGYDYL